MLFFSSSFTLQIVQVSFVIFITIITYSLICKSLTSFSLVLIINLVFLSLLVIFIFVNLKVFACIGFTSHVFDVNFIITFVKIRFRFLKALLIIIYLLMMTIDLMMGVVCDLSLDKIKGFHFTFLIGVHLLQTHTLLLFHLCIFCHFFTLDWQDS